MQLNFRLCTVDPCVHSLTYGSYSSDNNFTAFRSKYVSDYQWFLLAYCLPFAKTCITDL
jgi:hypothetical protein